MNNWASGFESLLLSYLLNSLWQVPLIFVAGLAAARLMRPAGPRMEHKVWVGALLLEVILPFCHLQWSELGRQAWGLVLWFRHAGAGDGQTRVVLGAGTAGGVDLPWRTAVVLLAIAAAYLCGVLYFAARLGWGIWTTERMRREAIPVEATEVVAGSLAVFARRLGGSCGDVELSCSAAFSGPATVGVWRHTLLMPPGFLETLGAEERDAVLAHELAHMLRWDFLKNLLYGVASLPAAFHPVLWLTRARVAETRELVCDAMAAEAVGGRESYARSLLRLARMLSDRKAPRLLHAIGILDANIFERRVMNLTRKSVEMGRVRRAAIGAACAVMGLAVCTSAMALRMDVKAAAPDSKAPSSVNVKPENMTLVSKVTPVYPPEAKKARVSGTVELSAIIGKDGTVEDLTVVKGAPELAQSAMDAVRQWKYQPYLLNGDPVEVKTTINVIYSLRK